MEDVNVSNDLRQLSLGQVKALKYSCYDINGYHFWAAKLEVSHPLIATRNNRVVTSGEYATGHIIDYYGILQNIVEYTFGGAKQMTPKCKKKGFNSLVMLVAWWLWKHRNTCVFDEVSPSTSRILQAIEEDAKLWCMAGAVGLRAVWP
jgi:hypothetical protein